MTLTNVKSLQHISFKASRFLKLTIAVIALLAAIPHRCFSQKITWEKFGDLKTPRHFFEALPISSNEILIMGGFINSNGLQTGTITNSSEIIDLKKNLISNALPMLEPRAEFVALHTPDSNIVVISGVKSNNGQLTKGCELYDRVLKTWKYIGELNIARRQHVARFINETEILVVGGRHADLSSMADAEIFNVQTGISRKVAPYPVVFNLAFATISTQGNFLICGGREAGPNSIRTKEVFRYDVLKNEWIKASELPTGLGAPQGITTFDGKTVISGGGLSEDPPLSSSEVFIEYDNQFSSIAKMNEGRTWHSLAQWNSDTIITISGFGNGGNKSISTDWINFKQKRAFKGPDVLEPHILFKAVSLPLRDASGNILKPRILAISGLGADNRNTPTVELLESVSPPVITVQQSSCTMIDVSISHTTQLDSAWLVESESENVTLGFVFTPAFPSQSVGAWIRLKNPLKPGKYKLRALYKSGSGNLTTDYAGTFSPTPIAISLSSTGFKTYCDGVAPTLDAGTGFEKYEWSTGETTPAITVTTSGKYAVTVMSKDSCFGTDTVAVNFVAPQKPNITVAEGTPCEGDSTMLDAGAGFKSYRWSTGETSQEIIVKKSGTFAVTTIDENGCEATSEVSITFKNTTGLEATSSLDSERRITLDAMYPGDVRCHDVSFKNTLDRVYALEQILLKNNIQFSVPLAQFPVIFQPGETKSITICFNPNQAGSFADTLIIGAEYCNPVFVAVHSEGLQDNFSGEADCNIRITAGAQQGLVALSAPYPNPTNDRMYINAVFKGDVSAQCVVRDVYGRIVQQAEFIPESQSHGKFILFVGELPQGLYFASIASFGAKTTFPVIVE
jgi:hypothetical protein